MADTHIAGDGATPEDLPDLDAFDAETDAEVEEAGDDPLKLKEIIKSRTETRQRLYARAKEAERKLKDKKENPTPAAKPGNQPSNQGLQSGDYAYLAVKGIEDDESLAVVEEAMKMMPGKSVREVLNSRYVQVELEGIKQQKENEGASPKPGNRAGNSAKNSVDYWIDKGELPPADQVELRRKVVNERYRRSKAGNKFGGV